MLRAPENFLRIGVVQEYRFNPDVKAIRVHPVPEDLGRNWPLDLGIVSDEKAFLELVTHIREFGYQGFFYQKPITYYDEDGLTYWTMGAPIGETTIINRCRTENTYEERLKKGTLPVTTHV